MTTSVILCNYLFSDSLIHPFVESVVGGMCALASLVCVLVLANGGYQYMTAAGKPDNLVYAKKLIRNAVIGLTIVLGASVFTTILNHALSNPTPTVSEQVPTLSSIQPHPAGGGLVDVLIKAITGLLQNIIQTIAAPFMHALSFFTSSTPSLVANGSVFHLWLAMVSITDMLFVLVVCLVGFHIMSYAMFGLEEIELRRVIPQMGLIFLLANTSIFVIDGLIELSNTMIHALNAISPVVSVWDVLSETTRQSGTLGVASLLIMVVFLVLSVMLLVYYVGRLVVLYVGALLAPLVCVLWLLPVFKDFVEAAVKIYLSVIFVLFVHVVILKLASSIFAGLTVGQPNHTPDPLMSLIVGLATVISLLRTQGLLMQLSYVGIGSRGVRKLGTQFVNVMSYTGSKGGRLAGDMVHAYTKDRYARAYSSIPTGVTFKPHELNNFNVDKPIVKKTQEAPVARGVEIRTKPVPISKVVRRNKK